MKKKHGFVLMTICLLACSVCLALNIPGADGSDGVLKITTADCTNGVYTIDLGRAATKQWDAKPTTAGCGVYDPEKWAVVFKYSSVQIDEGCTLKFVNHPSNPPVYWLVSGNVVINGEINLDGEHGRDTFMTAGNTTECATPGPGGFAGGISLKYDSGSELFYYGGGGYGPGGATSQIRIKKNMYEMPSVVGGGGSYATLGNSNSKTIQITNSSDAGSLYGDETLIPLVGGSGGAGYNGGANFTMIGGGAGGAGGGAICIATNGTVTLLGRINARGNRGGGFRSNNSNSFSFRGGCGSGGAVRIVADALVGAGIIDVSSQGATRQSLIQEGWTVYDNTNSFAVYDCSIGGAGRIRLDSNNITLCNRNFTSWSVQPSLGNSDSVVLWADAKITMLTLGGVALPEDPTYRQSGLNECVSFATAGERELVFRTENIPTDANVVVKVTPRQSSNSFTGTTVVATMDAGGTYASATWRAMIPLNDARTTFQVLVSTIPLND